MSKLNRVIVFPVLLLLTLLSTASVANEDSALQRIQARGELILGTSGNMPSMSLIDAAGRVSGFDIDLAGFMAQLMEVKLAIKIIPFDNLLSSLESGEVDVVISNVTITPKRNLKVAFVGPYLNSGKCFVTKDDALAGTESSSEKNVAETKLVVLEGSTSEDVARKLYPQATVVTVDYFGDAAEMVKKDEASAVLSDYPICMAILKDNPDAGFVNVVSMLTYEPIGIALPANDAQFINWTQNFLQRLDGTGTLQGLSKAWFGEAALQQ